MWNLGLFEGAFSFLGLLVWLGVIVHLLVLATRLVGAIEKIADRPRADGS